MVHSSYPALYITAIQLVLGAIPETSLEEFLSFKSVYMSMSKRRTQTTNGFSLKYGNIPNKKLCSHCLPSDIGLISLAVIMSAIP